MGQASPQFTGNFCNVVASITNEYEEIWNWRILLEHSSYCHFSVVNLPGRRSTFTTPSHRRRGSQTSRSRFCGGSSTVARHWLCHRVDDFSTWRIHNMALLRPKNFEWSPHISWTCHRFSEPEASLLRAQVFAMRASVASKSALCHCAMRSYCGNLWRSNHSFFWERQDAWENLDILSPTFLRELA